MTLDQDIETVREALIWLSENHGGAYSGNLAALDRIRARLQEAEAESRGLRKRLAALYPKETQ